MFGSLILPTGTGAGTRIRTGGINHPTIGGSGSGSIPYHPTIIIMSFPSSRSKLPPRIRASFTTSPADRVELISKPPNTTLNLYQILRIQHNASSLEIKTAYRKLAKQFHPDALPPTTSSSSDGAPDFMAIHNAYATLSDPTERARYDLSIQIQTTTTTTTTHTRRFHTYYSSAVDGNEKNRRSYGGMQTTRWETDQCW